MAEDHICQAGAKHTNLISFEVKWKAGNIMSCVRTRNEDREVQACIFDLSGTTADKYSLEYSAAVVKHFKKQQVPLNLIEVSEQMMGSTVFRRLQAIMSLPTVRTRWEETKGSEPTQRDIRVLHQSFNENVIENVYDYNGLLPGIKLGMEHLREGFSCKIGVNSEFERSVADKFFAQAREKGFRPNATVAVDEIKDGSCPRPYMLYRNMELLDVFSVQFVVKVASSFQGIEEGLNAGCWVVGVARYSSLMEVGSLEDEFSLKPDDIADRVKRVKQMLKEAGAHYSVESIANLPSVLRDINRRLRRNEKPSA